MILDESFDDEFFVVGGIVTLNDKLIEDAIYDMKKKIKKNPKIKGNLREKLLNEVKDHNLNGKLTGLKRNFFEKLKNDKDTIFIGAYINNTNELVEDKYFKCLKEILKYLHANISNINIRITHDNFAKIVYDEFQQQEKLENKILNLQNEFNIESIESKKSQEDTRIQGADLVIGLIRRIIKEEVSDFILDEDKLIIRHA